MQSLLPRGSCGPWNNLPNLTSLPHSPQGKLGQGSVWTSPTSTAGGEKARPSLKRWDLPESVGEGE